MGEALAGSAAPAPGPATKLTRALLLMFIGCVDALKIGRPDAGELLSAALSLQIELLADPLWAECTTALLGLGFGAVNLHLVLEAKEEAHDEAGRVHPAALEIAEELPQDSTDSR